MVTKAIHLEMVSDIIKDAFFGTLKHFIGRRYRPTDLFLGNGINFVGTNRGRSLVGFFIKRQKG